MSCEHPCGACQSNGFPILFTRYAAAYSAQSQGMAALATMVPNGNFQSSPHGVAMKTAKYNVRMLRAGYLYILALRKGLTPEWTAYAVHPHGYLGKFEPSAPQNAKSFPACEVEIRGANKSLVWVEDAKNVESFFYMFHPDPIDYAHLTTEIQSHPAKYMQAFDVKGWVEGNRGQKDTCTPAQLDAQVVEFAALGNDPLRDAVEPQMYGLMGASVQERDWGNYFEKRHFAETPGGAVTSVMRSHTVPLGSYTSKHGRRLEKMATTLVEKKGAVVACEDPVGIAQELGYLQAEAWTLYTRWQISPCPEFFAGVSNEWVYQTAMGAEGLMEMLKKGAMASTDVRIDKWERHQPQPLTVYGDAASRDADGVRRRTESMNNQKAARDKAAATGIEEHKKYFDIGGAKAIRESQARQYNGCLALLDALGSDQVAWLKATQLLTVLDRYSPHDLKVHLPGGGAALSMQLAQSLAGIESNTAGKALLQTLDPTGTDLLGRAMSFNSLTVAATLKALNASAAPAVLPDAERTTAVADWITDKLKLQAGKAGLGDKALGFIEAAPQLGDSALLRKMAWPLHLASLMSVKMMQGVHGLSPSETEARVVRFAAMTGLTTLGSKAPAYAQMLAVAERQRALAEAGKAAGKVFAASARAAVPNARAAGLAALFDTGFALLKGYQLKEKGDSRTAVEMVSGVLQGIGSIADFRAKAYEETIFKGAQGENLFTAVIDGEKLKVLDSTKLRSLRLTAFRFLLPAAMISVFWDVAETRLSFSRGNGRLAGGQIAGIVGSIFTITSTGMVAYGTILGIASTTWAAAAATLGLIGAVLVLGAFVAVSIFHEDEWLTWLQDNPLNIQRKGQKPIHTNLQNTLQQLANAQAAAA